MLSFTLFSEENTFSALKMLLIDHIAEELGIMVGIRLVKIIY